MTPTVTILAPAFNEAAVIQAFVTAVAEAADEILVVDDGSTDETPAILAQLSTQHPRVRVVTHPINRGLGAALVTGFAAATGDVVVTMDADLSHPIELLPDLVEACSETDAAFASRFVAGGGMPGVPWMRRFISRTANTLIRRLLRIPVRDMTTGYRAYRRAALEGLDLVGQRFETQLEITVRLVHARASIVELPLQLTTRAAGESKMRYGRLILRYGRMLLRLLRLRWLV